jgi:DNA polymerase V
MKSFYASVECAERGLNPFETNLVVADASRGRNALCLAVTPRMKALGVGNRCRMSDIPRDIRFITAPPRMQLYINYAADIYSLYLDYFSPQDIHVYSIDESFIDATDYLSMYGTGARELAGRLMNGIASATGVPSSAGIGTNLYLAKIALDMTAKHSRDHIGFLDEPTYRETLWDHRPITDFWQVAAGTAERLGRYGIATMRDVAGAPPELLYRLFGVGAELLIDHAWGRETCLISDIKAYKTKSRSVSFSQILPRDYTRDEARTVMREMLVNGAAELRRRHVICSRIDIMIGYSGDRLPPSHGGVRMSTATALESVMRPYVSAVYDRLAGSSCPVRRLGICFSGVCDEGCEGYDIFTDVDAAERERARDLAIGRLTDRFGRNAVLRGTSLLPEGTQRERNGFIGGHRAGYDDLG